MVAASTRAARLNDEYDAYRAVGLQPVIVAQGEPDRAAAYHREHGLPCPVLCDPDLMAYRAYGVGQWPVERILYDAPAEFWGHQRDVGRPSRTVVAKAGRPPVDDPWRATAEFVIGETGSRPAAVPLPVLRGLPRPARLLTTAARLS